jgi:succinate dehydrogenase / fumarate reductase, cytochrome b subunit
MYTMSMSIAHRITGVILTAGLLLLAWWLMAAATGPSAYAGASRVIGSGFVQLLLAGWLVAFVYHLCNGIRHLTWDLGFGLERHEARRSAWVTLVAVGVISATLSYLAFFARSAS